MFHGEQQIYLYWGQKVKCEVAIYKSAGVGLCTHVSAGFFVLSSLLIYSRTFIILCKKLDEFIICSFTVMFTLS